MKSHTASHIEKNLGDPFAQIKKTLGSFLAQSTSDYDLQKVLRTEAALKIREMLDAEELSGLAEELEVGEVEIISAQIMSFQVFPETILIHWCADAVEPGTPWSIESDVSHLGQLIEGVEAAQVLHFTGITGIDTINQQSYTTIDNISCIRKVDLESEEGVKATNLLPFNKMAEHMSLPLKITVEKKYAKLTKGTVLTLDSESMIYRDQDGGKGGVPADFILHVFFNSNPSSDLGKTFTADDFSAGIPFMGTFQEEEDEEGDEELSEAESLGGFLAQTQGDPDEEIQDSLIDEILNRKKHDNE